MNRLFSRSYKILAVITCLVTSVACKQRQAKSEAKAIIGELPGQSPEAGRLVSKMWLVESRPATQGPAAAAEMKYVLCASPCNVGLLPIGTDLGNIDQNKLRESCQRQPGALDLIAAEIDSKTLGESGIAAGSDAITALLDGKELHSFEDPAIFEYLFKHVVDNKRPEIAPKCIPVAGIRDAGKKISYQCSITYRKEGRYTSDQRLSSDEKSELIDAVTNVVNKCVIPADANEIRNCSVLRCSSITGPEKTRRLVEFNAPQLKEIEAIFTDNKVDRKIGFYLGN